MKSVDAERTIRHLCHAWRREDEQRQTSDEMLSSFRFLAWLRKNHPDCLNFHPQMSVAVDIDKWFCSEFGIEQ